MSLPYNPFNPARTYRIYGSQQTAPHLKASAVSMQSLPQNNNFTILLRNSEKKGLKSDTNFNSYMKTLRERHKISKSLIAKHRSTIEIQDAEKKNLLVMPDAKTSKKSRLTHQITELINEIKNPNYKKNRYQVTDDNERQQQLAKPLFFGIQNQARSKQQKRLIYSQVDVSKLRKQIFFDDEIYQKLKTQSQYSQAESNIQDQIKEFMLD